MKTVLTSVHIQSVYLEGPIDEVIKRLQSLKDQYGETVYLSEKYEDYSDVKSIHAYFKRPENPQEQAARENKEKRRAMQRLAYEREEFERLQKKFAK